MTKAVELAQVASTGVSEAFKNRIINGAMVIDQRNAGASVTPADGAYTLDRYQAWLSDASKISVQQSSIAPAGFSTSMLITSLSAFTITSNSEFGLTQKIEGLNVSDLGWGTANAQTVTLSFWVRSSLTGTFGGIIGNSALNRTYVFSYTISSANTWEQKSITIAGDTSGTWLTTNGIGITISFNVGAGSSRLSTAGSWGTNGNLRGVTGQTNLVATNGATLYLTGVQLEVGSSATSFETRPYGTELQLCQRYFEIMQQASIIGCADGSNVILCPYTYLVPKRATASITLLTPTVTVTEPTVASRTSSGATLGAGTGASSQSCIYQIFGFSSLTNQNVVMGGTAANTSILGISAEL